MSAIDETWEYGPLGGEITIRCGTAEHPDHYHIRFGHDADGRAQVAACAPEALRMLLECEGIACFCPDDGPHTEHISDCAWLALMVKAGLR